MREILIVHGGANMIRARAAALLVIKDFDRFQCIIFSGGKTGGVDALSEAESMRHIFLKGIHLLLPLQNTDNLERTIFLEEESYDTESNAQSVVKLLGISRKFRLTLLSSLTHLPRIESIYARLGFDHIRTISAEGLFYDTAIRSHQESIIKQIGSYIFFRSICMEIVLYSLTQFVYGRRWIRSKTRSRIQNPPSE